MRRRDKDEEVNGEMNNVMFYRNELKAIEIKNNKLKVEEFYTYLMDLEEEDRYKVMENKHDYVQWIFPTDQESNFNANSYKLLPKECAIMKDSMEIAIRYIAYYSLFLNFIGAELVDVVSGKIDVLKDERMRRLRFNNLNKNTHNHLRITRILKSLELFGFKCYKKELYTFLFAHHEEFKSCKDSMLCFWKPCAQRDHSHSSSYKDSVLFDEFKKLDDDKHSATLALDLLKKKYSIFQCNKNPENPDNTEHRENPPAE